MMVVNSKQLKIAQRYAQALCDLTDREMLLIGRVGLAMGLELEKIEQISRWVVDRIVWIEEGKIIFEKV